MNVLNLKEVGREEAAKRAAEVLSAGGILLYPTDTVYGLGVDATNPKALRALNALKEREAGKPMLVMLPSIGTIEEYAVLPEAAATLAEKFLPGPLTLVLPATSSLPGEVTSEGAIGIRVPNDSFCTALSHAFPKPITSTSANKAGLPTPAHVEEILEQLGDGIALAIDDGERGGGIPSTIVSFMFEDPRILREGRLPEAEIRAVLESD